MRDRIAFNVRKIAKSSNKSVEELSELLKESKESVLEMLSGKKEITLPDLKKISEFCNIQMENFFINIDKTNRNRIPKMIEKIIDIYLFHYPFSTKEFKEYVGSSY